MLCFSILMCLPAAGQNAWSEADCVTLLDSTSVTVQPNGSGSFAVYKSFKVQTPKGAVNNHVIKYDYDPLTAFARFKQVTVQRANGETMQVDVTKTCDYAAPARAIYWGARQIMLELGRLEPGDVVSYEISKKGFTYALLAGAEDDDARFIPPMRGQFYDIVPFWVNEPTRRKVYIVSMPMEKSFSSSSITVPVPRQCVMRTGERYIRLPWTKCFLSGKSPIWWIFLTKPRS